MASIQARHVRGCAIVAARTPSKKDYRDQWTTFAAATSGCTCPKGPLYHVVSRDGKKLVREPVGHNRKNAERELNKVNVQIDEGIYRPQPNVRFDEWADRWLAALQRKESTIDSYRSTIVYAKRAFGDVTVRRLRPEHVLKMDALMREPRSANCSCSDTGRKGCKDCGGTGRVATPGISASTRAKHLRVVHACINSAIAHGYGATNPVRELPKSEKPRAQRKEAAFFEDAELVRLQPEIADGVHRVLFQVALKTGMRLGELLALTWNDVDLGEALVRVRRTYTSGHVDEPKNHERRDVDLQPDTVELLGGWWGELGRPDGDVLVFPGAAGYLDPAAVLRAVLYPAMKRAGIPRVGPTGEKRTFHSLRHTFARIALEKGTQLTWLSRHLGHSSTAVTDRVYGHWARSARKAEAGKLVGAFPV